MPLTPRGCLLLALAFLPALHGPVFAQALAMIPQPAGQPPSKVISEQTPAILGPPHPVADPLRIFTAVADADSEVLRRALNAGGDPNAPLPMPAPPGFRQRYRSGDLEYYARREVGFTPLMLAAALGDERSARFLLAAGADPLQKSRTNRLLPLHLAANAGHVGMMRLLMGITPDSEPAQFRVVVDIASQRVVVWRGHEAIIFSPISSGKASTPTPRGTYLVTDKHRHWTSTIFHAKMPFFLRLSCGDFGLHAGNLPGYPASHGCVRLPAEKAEEIFASVPVGALVEIR